MLSRWSIVIAAGLFLFACSKGEYRESQSRLMLGTAITVTLYEKGPADTFDRIFARVQEIEEKMSTSVEDYTDTELLRVNGSAGVQAEQVSQDTFEVVRQALEYSATSGGAFDVSVWPLVVLWAIGTEYAAIPQADELQRTLALVDYHQVQLDPIERTIYLPVAGMGVDVGGIAKGYAADEAARILTEAGIEHALLDFGGNILTVGTKPDGSEWRIGIQTPDSSRGEYLGIAYVVDQSVVTSGTYERFFVEDSVRYHHILDPKTGYPVQNGLGSVTIIADESMVADALSTAVFVLGLDAGLAFVEELHGVEALFVTVENEVYRTSGLVNSFVLDNEAFVLKN